MYMAVGKEVENIFCNAGGGGTNILGKSEKGNTNAIKHLKMSSSPSSASLRAASIVEAARRLLLSKN